MSKININWLHTCEIRDGDTADTLIIINYNGGKCTQYYLNHTKTEAAEKFELGMSQRTAYEIEKEGWDAEGFEVKFSSEGEAWVAKPGVAQEQIQELSNMLLGDFFKDK